MFLEIKRKPLLLFSSEDFFLIVVLDEKVQVALIMCDKYVCNSANIGWNNQGKLLTKHKVP